MINGVSLFSNVGIAELYLKEMGIEIVVANELLEERASFYNHVFPNTNMIIGDIQNKEIYKKIIQESLNNKCKFLIAAPPCQGMSVAGKRNNNDQRNKLILKVLDAIDDINPDFVIIENVVQQLRAEIEYEGRNQKIIDIIKNRISGKYYINEKKSLNMKDYGIPQNRNRSIILLNKYDKWEYPEEESKEITVEDTIAHLPSFEARVREKDKVIEGNKEKIRKAEKTHKYHTPRIHPWRHVLAMMHTPTGKSAFENRIHYPKKINGDRVKGYNTTYKRMDWDRPAPTITTNSGAISSQANVHPGRKNIDGTYSDARALSIYELMLLMTIPDDWKIPSDATDTFIRKVIGEGIPPLMIKKIISTMPR